MRDNKKGKVKEGIADIEISDSLGKKISKVSKSMPWYRKITPMANQNFFKRKLYRKLTEEEKKEFEKNQKNIMEIACK